MIRNDSNLSIDSEDGELRERLLVGIGVGSAPDSARESCAGSQSNSGAMLKGAGQHAQNFGKQNSVVSTSTAGSRGSQFGGLALHQASTGTAVSQNSASTTIAGIGSQIALQELAGWTSSTHMAHQNLPPAGGARNPHAEAKRPSWSDAASAPPPSVPQHPPMPRRSLTSQQQVDHSMTAAQSQSTSAGVPTSGSHATPQWPGSAMAAPRSSSLPVQPGRPALPQQPVPLPVRGTSLSPRAMPGSIQGAYGMNATGGFARMPGMVPVPCGGRIASRSPHHY